MALIDIPKRIGYAGGNLKGLDRVLDEIALAIDQGDFSNVTATSAEINALHDAAAVKADFVKLHAISSAAVAIDAAVAQGAAAVQVYEKVVTLAQLNAGVTAVVPAVSGKRFIALDAWMEAVGADPAAGTLIRLKEETNNAVVMSHVIADFASNAVVGKTGGTVVITKLGTPLTANKAILMDATGDPMTTVTSIHAIVVGFYV
jgi:hypothetical protein